MYGIVFYNCCNVGRAQVNLVHSFQFFIKFLVLVKEVKKKIS